LAKARARDQCYEKDRYQDKEPFHVSSPDGLVAARFSS
jgi:hypothetical protein